MRIRIGMAALGFSLLASVPSVQAQVPPGYPADYQTIIDQAKKEARLVVVGTNGIAQVNPFLEAFGKLYPFIKVDYTELNSGTLLSRLSSEIATSASTADVAISGAADFQLQMGKQGMALRYSSPAKSALSPGNVWEDQVYNVDLEPVCNLYNKNQLSPNEVPKTHADLRKLMFSDPARFQGKINMYDIERSAVGFGVVYRDSKLDPKFWDLPPALAKVGARFQPGGFIMSEKVGSGETTIAFDIPCQILAALKDNPNIGFFLFEDYTIMTSQAILITKPAAHQASAKLFLDFMLSRQGQQMFADMPGIYSVRNDVKGADTTGLQQKGIDVSAPALNDDLLEPLDPAKKGAFLNRWKAGLRDGGTK